MAAVCLGVRHVLEIVENWPAQKGSINFALRDGLRLRALLAIQHRVKQNIFLVDVFTVVQIGLQSGALSNSV